MDYKKANFCAVFLFLLGLSGLQAQGVIPATGGNASGNGGSVSYSIGQTVYRSNEGAGGSVSPGVQQLYEISIKTEMKKTKGITLQCTVSPNPTTDFIMLKVEDFQLENLSYQLFDMSGKLLESKLVENMETSIAMDQHPSATYFLKVIQKNEVVKSFKIIKK